MSQKIISLLLILISLITLTKCNFPYVSCEKKTKVHNICGVLLPDSFSNNNKMYLKKNCEEDEICEVSNKETQFSICKKKIKLRDKGERCTFDLDCKGEMCDGHCYTVGSGEICKNHFSCEPGYYCKDTGGELKCTPLLSENENCKEDDVCEPGTICNYPFTDSSGVVSGKCLKIGSLKDGKETKEAFYCKSGLQYKDSCISISEDGECNKNGKEYTCTLKIIGFNVTELTLECDNYYTEQVCPFSQLKTKLFEKYVDKLNKIDLNKFNKNDKHRIEGNNTFYLDDGDTYTAFIKYNYYSELRNTGIMDKKGHIDKNCEFKYILRTSSGNIIKVNRIMTILFGILIFFL